MRFQRINTHLRFPYINDLENPAASEKASFIIWVRIAGLLEDACALVSSDTLNKMKNI
jgi:hypothetical protein